MSKEGKKTKIYVCTEGKKCPKKGSEKVAKALHRAVEEQGADIVVKECKCLDLCKKGPAVVVVPDKAKYGRVTPEDAAEIVAAAKSGSGPVKRLEVKKKD